MLKRFFPLFFLSIIAFSQAIYAAESVRSGSEQPKLNRQKIDLGERVFDQIKANKTNEDLFHSLYYQPMTPANVIDALSHYERSLATYSRFDDYLRGNKNALTAEEKHGYALFQSYGCAACHNGPNVGGSQFKKMGQAKSYFVARKTIITPADLGLYEVTKKTDDMNVFRVPSLRNTAIISPYYHDGSVKTLDQAVYLMGKYQVGVEIPPKDVKAIVAYLKTLTAKSLEEKNN